jgi:hypothetical protein
MFLFFELLANCCMYIKGNKKVQEIRFIKCLNQ